jgi:hypothetical protein
VRIWAFQNANYDGTFDLDRDMPIIDQKSGSSTRPTLI